MKKELESLLIELETAYSKSSISEMCEREGVSWGYGLVTTSLKPHRPLFLGFNWGAGSGTDFSSQRTIETESFLEQDLGSFRRIVPYCQKYLSENELVEASQSNFCFFRSKSESQVCSSDIQLCEPIFNRLLSILNPSMVLGFSGKLRSYLIDRGFVENIRSKQILFRRGTSDITYRVQKGMLKGGVEIFFLPHPNYPMRKEARNQAWDYCFKSD